MKRLVVLMVSLLLTLCVARSVQAQSGSGGSTAQTQGQASARIIYPISIESTKDLSFGAIIKGNGTVTITPTSDVAAPGSGIVVPNGVTMLPQYQNVLNFGYGQSNFRVTGEPGFAFTIALPGQSGNPNTTGNLMIQNNPPLPAHKLLVNNFTSYPAGAGVIDNGGVAYFNVGATLHCDATKRAGIYRAEFAVVVQYQ
jgi:hypothetical protein